MKYPELFYYDGKNVEDLAQFIGLDEDDYTTQELKDGLFMLFFDGLYVAPMSVVRYDPETDMLDLFVYEKSNR
jgi:hypothetical protein